MKAPILILAFCIIIIAGAAFSQASQIPTHQSQPLANKSFNPNQTMLQNQNLGDRCVYFATITTSCISPPYTTDIIGLSFADVYGNKVSVERVDDPVSGRFMKCSTVTLEIYAPKCISQICYFALIRSGPDGWMPETVTISGPNSVPLQIIYNTFLPEGLWYGIDKC